MTPSQRIHQIADELMALNRDLDLQVALQNATITYLDEREATYQSAKVTI